jgi:hypothetical protein
MIMKTKLILALVTVPLIMASTVVSSSAALQTDSSMQTFWTKFKSAVTRGDKEGVVAMSEFPVEMPYGIPRIKTRVQLLKRYRELFNVQADAVKCFANATPTVDSQNKNRFTVGCKDKAGNEVVVYGFAKKRDVWKLISLDNINE